MPGLNRKGPNGDGAMTGRKMGQCSPENKGKTVDEIRESKFGFSSAGESGLQGRGMGRRRGRGCASQGRGMGRGLGRGHGFEN